MLLAPWRSPSPGSTRSFQTSQTIRPRSSSTRATRSGTAASRCREGRHGLDDPVADLLAAGESPYRVLPVGRVLGEGSANRLQSPEPAVGRPRPGSAGRPSRARRATRGRRCGGGAHVGTVGPSARNRKPFYSGAGDAWRRGARDPKPPPSSLPVDPRTRGSVEHTEGGPPAPHQETKLVDTSLYPLSRSPPHRRREHAGPRRRGPPSPASSPGPDARPARRPDAPPTLRSSPPSGARLTELRLVIKTITAVVIIQSIPVGAAPTLT